MVRSCLALLLSVSLLEACSANGVSPVQKVVHMIDEMAAKVQEELSAVIEDSSAKISDAESRVLDASAKISEQEAELHESKQWRAKEREQFLSTERYS